MRQEKKDRILLGITLGVFVLAGVLFMAAVAFGQDCVQGADGSWDCKRPIAGLDIGGWRAARGKAPIFQKAHPAVCRIFVDRPVTKAGKRMIETCVGSGVLVWRGTEQAVVLTVHHLFRDRGTKIRVVFPNGEKYEAEQVQSESDPDLGALTIPRPGVEPMVISEDDPPRPGDRVFLCGFDGKTGNYRRTPGVVKGYSAHRTSSGFTPEHDLAVIGGAVEGNSGGPIVDEDGELVAIIWGTDGRMTYGSYANRIGTFLTSQKFVAPWADTDKITPWNAKTEREKIKAAAGAYAPPPAQIVPVAPATGSMDTVARQMAQDALNQIEMMTPELLKAKSQLDILMAASSQSNSRGIAAETKAEEAVRIAEEASTGIATLKTGLLGTVKGYVFGLFKTWGLGGLLGGGILGVGIFFLLRRFLAMKMAEYFDKLTDKIPGTLDDKYLDPIVWKLASVISGKPVPEYANKPGFDPWGRPLPGQQPPPPEQAVVPPAPSPTVAELQAQIDALKVTK
jgi:S1-C subfamily serine protease